jgi:hypothetical protein
MVPEVDAKGVTTGFVPKHDIATEQGQPLFHAFDKGGKQVREPVRLLDEDFFDKGMKPAMHDRIRGMVQEHLKEYSNKSGRQIDINSPEAKLVGRAIAYDMLNVESRKGGTIGDLDIDGKPSQASATLNVHESPAFLKSVEDIAAAHKRGTNSELTPAQLEKLNKRNIGEAIGSVFSGKEDGQHVKLNGEMYDPGGKAIPMKDLQDIDVTGSMPDGGIKAGTGANHSFNGVYFDPKGRQLIIEKEETVKGAKRTNYIQVPESNVGQFINRYAEANNINKTSVKALLEKMNYSNGKFNATAQPAAVAPAATDPNAADFNKRKKSWRNAYPKKATEAIKNPLGQSNP